MNGNVQVSFVKEYFPQMIGLLYENYDGLHAVPVDDGYFVINYNFNTYQVHRKSNGMYHNTSIYKNAYMCIQYTFDF